MVDKLMNEISSYVLVVFTVTIFSVILFHGLLKDSEQQSFELVSSSLNEEKELDYNVPESSFNEKSQIDKEQEQEVDDSVKDKALLEGKKGNKEG